MTKILKNNYQKLESALTNKILNNIENEEKEKLLHKNEDQDINETNQEKILVIIIILIY